MEVECLGLGRRGFGGVRVLGNEGEGVVEE